MLSRSFGHGDVLLWFIEIFLFVVWFWLFVNIFRDLVRDHEVSGFAKAIWILLVLLFPFIGVLAYLIFRGEGMSARTPRSAADQIRQAKALLDAGAIDRAEFDRLKAKALE